MDPAFSVADKVYYSMTDDMQQLIYGAYLVTQHPVEYKLAELDNKIWNNIGNMILSMHDLYVENYKFNCITYSDDLILPAANLSCNNIIDINNKNNMLTNIIIIIVLFVVFGLIYLLNNNE